ncbi:MAG TPA: ATP-binding protein [Roseiflexaceae bacterium]
MTLTNPFTERGRITHPERFAGRWAELSLIFERLEAGRPVLIAGPPGIGKSSLLTHVTQSAAVNLELPELRAFYLNLAGGGSAAAVYQTVATALGQPGDTLAALELAVIAAGEPVLLCLDDAQVAIAAGWGAGLLESLARIVRGGSLLLVVAVEGAAPLLSERFAAISLGALAPTEVRLLVDAYLDGAGVSFTPAELRDIAVLSYAHPAYVQRAAFHLFQSKLDPSLDWRAAYLAEARARPIPGAPLPTAVFEGQGKGWLAQSAYGEEQYAGATKSPQQIPLPETPTALIFGIPLLGALLLLALTGSLPLALVVAIVGSVGVALWLRRGR